MVQRKKCKCSITYWLRMLNNSRSTLTMVLSILATTFLLFFIVDLFSSGRTSSDEKKQLPSESPQDLKQNETRREKIEYVFVFVLCWSTEVEKKAAVGGRDKSSETRLTEQAVMMIKSAVALTNKQLKFIAVTDSKMAFEFFRIQLKVQIPEKFRDRLQLIHKNVWYPENRTAMRQLFKACSTERLFMTEVLNNFDSVIYVDTDVLFMRPPEDIWEEFETFKNGESVALGERLFYFVNDGRPAMPHFGETGLNPGVLLMNMTRLDQFPGGWINSLSKIADEYRGLLKFGDQDILNILFAEHPNQVHNLSCDWNYRVIPCEHTQFNCVAAETHGASIIHGIGSKFYSEKVPYLKIIFNAWKDYRLGVSLLELALKMQADMRRYDETNGPPKPCPKYRNLFNTLVRRLKASAIQNIKS